MSAKRQARGLEVRVGGNLDIGGGKMRWRRLVYIVLLKLNHEQFCNHVLN